MADFPARRTGDHVPPVFITIQALTLVNEIMQKEMIVAPDRNHVFALEVFTMYPYFPNMKFA